MASARPDRSSGGAGALRRATVLRNAPRPPRPANDNPARLSDRLFRLVPFLMATLLLFWASWNLEP